jgi:hypothetical protein
MRRWLYTAHCLPVPCPGCEFCHQGVKIGWAELPPMDIDYPEPASVEWWTAEKVKRFTDIFGFPGDCSQPEANPVSAQRLAEALKGKT